MLALKMSMASLLKIRQKSSCIEVFFNGLSNSNQSLNLLLEQVQAVVDKTQAKVLFFEVNYNYHLFITQLPPRSRKREYLLASLRQLFHDYHVRYITFWNDAPLF